MRKRLVKKIIAMVLCFTTLILCFAGCGKDEKKDTGKNTSTEKKFAGQKIDVLLPPWYSFTDEFLKPFEDETGIDVNFENMKWDDLYDKLITSCAAGIAPADVTIMSGNWIKKFYESGWYEPLNQYLDEDFFSRIVGTDKFKYEDKYIGVPLYNDFRLSYVNKEYYEKAGIKEMPKTPEKLMEDAIKIKKSGACEYPISLCLSATEGTTTPWFLLTKAFGGELFDEEWNPLFEDKNSAAYKAMSFIMDGLHKYKVIDPASIELEGQDVVDNFKQGIGAIDLAGWSGNVQGYTDEKTSKIAKTVEIINVPGVNENSRTYGLQEGIAIPAKSKNKEAAAEFIKWLNRTEIVEKLYTEYSIFPNHKEVVKKLSDDNKIAQGEKVIQAMDTIELLHKKGFADWDSSFMTDAYTTMNQMAKGAMTVDEGMKHMADNVRKLKAENK